MGEVWSELSHGGLAWWALLERRAEGGVDERDPFVGDHRHKYVGGLCVEDWLGKGRGKREPCPGNP